MCHAITENSGNKSNLRWKMGVGYRERQGRSGGWEWGTEMQGIRTETR